METHLESPHLTPDVFGDLLEISLALLDFDFPLKEFKKKRRDAASGQIY